MHSYVFGKLVIYMYSRLSTQLQLLIAILFIVCRFYHNY